MPSTIQTPAEYLRKLRQAIVDMEKRSADLRDPALKEILAQLRLAEQWTRDGKAPTLEQKGQLGFGLIASKYLDDVDQELAQRIYDIASFITYW